MDFDSILILNRWGVGWLAHPRSMAKSLSQNSRSMANSLSPCSRSIAKSLSFRKSSMAKSLRCKPNAPLHRLSPTAQLFGYQHNSAAEKRTALSTLHTRSLLPTAASSANVLFFLQSSDTQQRQTSARYIPRNNALGIPMGNG